MAYREHELPPATVQDSLLLARSEDLTRLLRAAVVAKPFPTRKADMAVELDKQLSGKALRTLWNKLDPLQQAAVAETAHDMFGGFKARQFAAKYGDVPKGYRLKGYHETSILRLFLYPYTHYGLPAFMPDELAMRLRDFVAPPEPATLATEDELPDAVQRAERLQWRNEFAEEVVALVQLDMERAAQQDLLAVLRLIDGGKVAVGAKTGRASTAAMARIADVLAGGDFYSEKPDRRRQQVAGPIRAFAWPWLMQSGRLAKQRGSKLELTKAGRQALRRPAAETLRLLWRQWRQNKLLDEFSRIDVFKGQTSAKSKRAMTTPAGRRAVVEEALADCPVGGWVSVDEFWRYMVAADYDFEVTLEPWRLYIIDSRYGTLEHAKWSMMQGRYVSCLLLEYAATLGMIDVAITPPACARDDFMDYGATEELDYLTRYDGLWYFRLNPLGAYCLELVDQYEPTIAPSQGAISVFADRRVRTLGELSFDEKLLLDLYGKAESEDTWRLDGDKLLTALESGHDLAELRDFLSQRDDQPLPDQVEGFLRRTERNAKALKSRGDAMLVECADEAVVARVLGDGRVSKLCLPAGERHLVVPAKAVARFRKAIRGMGLGISAE